MRNRRLDEIELVAIDTETTGLYAISGRLLEIGAVRFTLDGSVHGEYQQLINPGESIAPEVQQINRISDDMVAEEPTVDQVLPGLVDFLDSDNTLVMAHNAAFDLGFLGAAFSKCGITLPALPVLDTLALARLLLPRAPNHKLETLCTVLSLPRGTHRALADAHAVRALFLALAQTRPDVQTLEQLHQLTPLLGFADGDVVPIEAPPGFEALALAMEERRIVTIVYDGGSKGIAPRPVTPISLLRSNGASFLLARCELEGRDKQFRLDRVREVR